jgi:hypothetical protein
MMARDVAGPLPQLEAGALVGARFPHHLRYDESVGVIVGVEIGPSTNAGGAAEVYAKLGQLASLVAGSGARGRMGGCFCRDPYPMYALRPAILNINIFDGRRANNCWRTSSPSFIGGGCGCRLLRTPATQSRVIRGLCRYLQKGPPMAPFSSGWRTETVPEKRFSVPPAFSAAAVWTVRIGVQCRGTGRYADAAPYRHRPHQYSSLFVAVADLHAEIAVPEARKMVASMQSKGDLDGADLGLRIVVALEAMISAARSRS